MPDSIFSAGCFPRSLARRLVAAPLLAAALLCGGLALSGCGGGEAAVEEGAPANPSLPTLDGIGQVKTQVEYIAESGQLDETIDSVYEAIAALPDSPEKEEALEAFNKMGAATGNPGRVKKSAKELLAALDNLSGV